MTDIKLSRRMQAVADMVNEKSVADIGCDHAFVSMYLIKSNKADKVIAMDVKKGPLNIAKENIANYSMDKLIETRLSYGFDNLSVGEVECAIIAGMGGELITDILKRGSNHTDNGIHLVLQPQSEPWKVREYLYNIGYEIIDEEMLIEEEKYYSIIKAIPAMTKIGEYSDVELRYGRQLLYKKHAVLKKYIEDNRRKNLELYNQLEHIHTEKSDLRRAVLKEEILFDEQALKLFI